MRLLRKHAGVVAFLLLTLGFGIYMFVVDKKTITTSESAARKQFLFPAWRKDEITRVTMKLSGELVELASRPNPREGDPNARAWDVTIDGTSYQADEQAVDKLLGTLQYGQWKREVPSGSVDRAAFGLDAPKESIDVVMGELTMHLDIGAPAPTAGEIYAEVKGRGVYTVAADFASLVIPSADDLRDKAFVPYLSTELAGIEISGDGGDRKFERAGWNGGRGSGFRIAGSGVRADGDIMDRVFVAMGKMQADAFVDDATADQTSTARVTLTLVPRDGPKATIVLGGPCPAKKNHVLAIRRDPTRLAACVPDLVMAPLSEPLSSFEDTHLVGAALDEIVEVSLERGDKKLDIARSGSGFKMRSPDDKTVSGDRGNALIDEMLLVKGEFAPDDTAPAGDPIVATIWSAGGVTAAGADAERTEKISIYPPKDDQDAAARALAVRAEDGKKLWVPRSVLHTFAPNDLLVRDLDVTNERGEDLVSLRLEGEGKKQLAEKKADAWSLVEPKGKGLEPDMETISNLAGEITHLKTSRWVAEKDDGTFGLAEPRYTIEAKLAASKDKPERTIQVIIGAKTTEGSYAKLASDPAVFLAPAALEDDAGKWLVSRPAFTIASESVDHLTVEAEGKKLELVRDGKLLRVAGKTDKNADELAAVVGDALDDLLPTAVVSVGAAADYQGLAKPTMKIDAKVNGKDATIQIGSGDVFERTAIHYARRNGIDATYAVPQSVVRRLIEAVTEK